MKKRTRLKINSWFTVFLLLAVFILLAWASNRFAFEADLTREGRHTLSSASIEVLSKLEHPLDVSAYARENSELRGLIENFISRFQQHYKDINLHFINPDAVPDEVRSLGINVNGELVLRYKGRSEHVKTESEQKFINALQRLLRESERWIAFLDGHGERKPGGKANHDLGEWVAQLAYRGFKYRPLNLAETRVIPDNTSVLVIASPLVQLLPGELDIIEAYIKRGGNLLWLTDPGETPDLSRLADILNIKILPGVSIDSAGQLLGINDPSIVLTTRQLYPRHPVTENFDLTVFFPKTAALHWSESEHWAYRPLLLTGNHTWLERGVLEGEVDFDPDSEIKGPLTIGMTLERSYELADRTEQQQRIVIIGDGDFLSNTYVGNSGNMELGMRLMNWLSADDDLITIPARTIDDKELNMSELSVGAFGIFFLMLLPLSLLFTAFTIWNRRRKK